ncbi:MAG: hypothetical protein B9S32_14620 [Verrucomicrobia bacterium Tous-C9LFEB]|nr:MAG: hypothetical protein B9S32_14620 [Verrucomicrobia bacterium Tous-C9LFEB]
MRFLPAPIWFRSQLMGLAALMAVGYFGGISSTLANGQSDPLSIFDRAVAEDLPGKYVKGGCLPFARELYIRLNRAGGEVHLITYAWRKSADEAGIHAFVVYRDEDGRYWGMDNERYRPLWMSGTTPQAWGQFFSPSTTVSIRSHVSSLRPPPARNRVTLSRTVAVASPVPVERRAPAKVEGQEMIAAMSGQSQAAPLYFSSVP